MTYISFPIFERRRLLSPKRVPKNSAAAPYRTAGIIGGLGPQSTSLFYEALTEICWAQSSTAFPRLLINSVNMWEVTALLDEKDLEGLYFFLKREIGLIAEQADFLIMICNSVHAVLEPLRRHFGIPILSIYEEVCKEIALAQHRKVGILGTCTTIRSQFYQRELATYGIAYTLLPEEAMIQLDQCIFQEILHGSGTQRMKQLLLNGIQHLADQGCEAVVLGCTEFPLFVRQADTDVPLFSSTELLARTVVEECFR